MPREVYVRIEALAGVQSQIDWAHVGHLRVPGGVRPLYCFVLLLRHSRAMWAEFVFEQTTESLLRSLMRAAQYFRKQSTDGCGPGPASGRGPAVDAPRRSPSSRVARVSATYRTLGS